MFLIRPWNPEPNMGDQAISPCIASLKFVNPRSDAFLPPFNKSVREGAAAVARRIDKGFHSLRERGLL